MRNDMGIYESCIVASRLRGRVEEAGDRNAIRLVHDDSVLRQGADALAVLDEDERHRNKESTAQAKTCQELAMPSSVVTSIDSGG